MRVSLACALACALALAQLGGVFAAEAFARDLFPGRKYRAGDTPAAVAAADLDGDGARDLVSADAFSDTVSVLFGRGDGTFGNAHALATGDLPIDVAIADLDGDALPDLLTVNANGNSVSLLRGNGDGTFQPVEAVPLGFEPRNVAIADMDGDALPDLVVSSHSSGSVSVLLGNGNGSFQPPATAATGGNTASLQLADVNGDGDLDVVVLNLYGETVQVLLGNGDGTLEPPRTQGVYWNLTALAVGDVTGDSLPDLVVASGSDDSARIMAGNGDGSFRSPSGVYSTVHEASVVELVDLDGDAQLDLLTSNEYDDELCIRLGVGNGSFGTATLVRVADRPAGLAIADFDGDAVPDIATANQFSDDLSVLLGRGDGTFPPPGPTYVARPAPVALAIGDLNADGAPDVVTANTGVASLSVLLGTGSGSLQPPTNLETTALGEPQAVAIGDLNGDQAQDLAVAIPFQSELNVFLGNGNGTFQPATAHATAGRPRSVALGDLNGDGLLDLVAANDNRREVTVLLGQGDGSFLNAPPVGTFAVFPVFVAIGDLDGDGVADLVVCFSNSLGVFLGQGQATFVFANAYPVAGAGAVAIGDLDGDAIPDLASVHAASNNVSVLLGNGNGSFGPAAYFAVREDPRSIAIGDFDRDGHLDLVTADSDSDTTSVLLGRGDGSFDDAEAFLTGESPFGVAIADLDRDGLLDIVAANFGADSVTVLLNASPAAPAVPALPGAGFAVAVLLLLLAGSGLWSLRGFRRGPAAPRLVRDGRRRLAHLRRSPRVAAPDGSRLRDRASGRRPRRVRGAPARAVTVQLRTVNILVLLSCAPALAAGLASASPALEHCLEESALLRVARVVGPDRAAAYVRVVAHEDGVPTMVVPIASADLDLAQVFARAADSAVTTPVWTIAASERADRICSPVRIDRDEIEAATRVVVAAGLNYAAHAEEAGGGDVFLFPKPVEPTPPYGHVAAPAGVTLLDYEVELAFVLLADIDIRALPSRADLLARSAFFVANDVTDREPIIVHQPLSGVSTGFVDAKGQPGFLPAGPWLVRGTELFAALASCGGAGLGIALDVDEGEGFRSRQDATTEAMILEPRALLARIADEVARQGAVSPMPRRGADGERHFALAVASADGDAVRLPAGSVVLTGTPEGVAMRAPSPLGAVLRGLLHLRGPLEQFRQDELARAASGAPGGYLEPGDRVRARIDGLGAQIVLIAEPGAAQPLDPCGARREVGRP